MNKSLLITGGGTGGHLSPAIALFEECKSRGIDAYMLIGEKDRKFNYLREVDSDKLISYGAPSFSKNPFMIPFFIIRFFFSVFKAMRIMKRIGADDVVGMGGYVSAPALMAAKFTKRNIFLCEQNTVPGKVTVRFAKKAKYIFGTFDESRDYFKPEIRAKIITAGNPIRKKVLCDMDKNSAKKYFNLGHCSKIVLVIGGSQGALQLNDLIMNLKLNYQSDFSDVGIIWCTGSLSYEKYSKIVKENSKMGSVYISPFVEDVGIAYRAADIAISRSGSGVMMEFAAMELPSVLIPYPYAAADHQNKNADAFASVGAAVKVQSSVAKADTFAPMLFSLISSESRINQMKNACIKAAKLNAAADIIDNIIR